MDGEEALAVLMTDVGLYSPIFWETVRVQSDVELMHILHRNPSALFSYFKNALEKRFPGNELHEGERIFNDDGIVTMIVYMKALHYYFIHNIRLPTNTDGSLKDPCNYNTLYNMQMDPAHTGQTVTAYCRFVRTEVEPKMFPDQTYARYDYVRGR
jgi:hypothetical protein